MVEALAPYFDFYIVTLNHDSGSRDTYSSVRTGAWNHVGSAQVFYVKSWTVGAIRTALREIQPDALYLNGFFSTSSVTALLGRRLGMLKEQRIVLATRGDLAAGALGLKSLKKDIYVKLARQLGLYRGLWWHASSVREKSEMLSKLCVFGVPDKAVHVAPDLGFGYKKMNSERPKKVAGEARFVTLSRIDRMKNLLFTIDRLAELKGSVSLDIFGPMQDKEYWAECEKRIAALPGNVNVKYHGFLSPDSVLGELSQRHYFLLPTLGENYGHAIIEGAAAGCPVVISDRTQWVGLAEKRVGWDIRLEEPSTWNSTLQKCVDMPQEEFRQLSERAAEFGQSIMHSRVNLEANIELFRKALKANCDEVEPTSNAELAL